MAELVRLTRHDDIAVITIDNPPVNALSPGVPEGIQALLDEAAQDSHVRAVVVMGAGQTFIAGADIREFAKIVSGESPRLSLYPFLLAIEDCPKPVVMAIHGAAFGGGLETAMAGHYRVIALGAQVGQPEVKLGLIPGAGGTQRLPRLVGVAKALEMCASGQSIPAREAVELGVADSLIEGDLLEGAIAFARAVAANPAPKTRERHEKLRDAHPALFTMARERARKSGRGMTAPLAAIDAVEAAAWRTFDEGCRREAELFDECLYSSQSRALIHAFFGERTVAKIPGLPKDVRPAEIARAAVIGAGTMGGGIAMTFANAGIPVIVKETAPDALERGMNVIRGKIRRQRLAFASGRGAAARAHHASTNLRGLRPGRHHRGGGLRKYGRQEASVCRDSEDRQARLRPGFQHVEPGYR
jgi:3-hydroxyacyl-CoA dehydrogenase